MRGRPAPGSCGRMAERRGRGWRSHPLPGPRWHVRGATKFYRRECYEQIQPIPAHLGWDMIDEVKARRAGWRTESFELPGGDTLHLRPTGRHDGQLRAYRRWGACAWGYGAHPAFVLLGAIKRLPRRPFVCRRSAVRDRLCGGRAAPAAARGARGPRVRAARRGAPGARRAHPCRVAVAGRARARDRSPRARLRSSRDA